MTVYYYVEELKVVGDIRQVLVAFLTLSQTSMFFFFTCLPYKSFVTSNFFFPHRVFYPFGKASAILIKCEIVICKLFPTQWRLLTPLGNKPFENTVGKGEIARNEQFLLFPQCFLPVLIAFRHFHQIWNCRLQTLSVWKSLKFVIW